MAGYPTEGAAFGALGRSLQVRDGYFSSVGLVACARERASAPMAAGGSSHQALMPTAASAAVAASATATVSAMRGSSPSEAIVRAGCGESDLDHESQWAYLSPLVNEGLLDDGGRGARSGLRRDVCRVVGEASPRASGKTSVSSMRTPAWPDALPDGVGSRSCADFEWCPGEGSAGRPAGAPCCVLRV